MRPLIVPCAVAAYRHGLPNAKATTVAATNGERRTFIGCVPPTWRECVEGDFKGAQAHPAATSRRSIERYRASEVTIRDAVQQSEWPIETGVTLCWGRTCVNHRGSSICTSTTPPAALVTRGARFRAISV